jgi:hypothetical protein
MKFNDVFQDTVEKIINNSKQVPMLLGEPGIGKSSWVEDLGRKLHTKVFTLACNQLADKADLTGARLVPVETSTGETTYEQVFYPHAVIRRAIAYAIENPHETPILFLDELNRTTPDVTSELLSIPTLRAIGNTDLPENLRVITAGNDKGNITTLDEASISRFVLFPVEPDVETFIQVNTELNPFVKTVLMQHPESLFCKMVQAVTSQSDDDDDDDDGMTSIDEILDDGEDMNQITTPRTITGVSNWLNCYDNAALMTLLQETRNRDGEEVSLLQEIIEGFTGRTNFTKFLMAEIATNLMTVNNQSNVTSVPKPQCYDKMKQCPDITALNQFISTMSDHDKSGCLVYALYEKTDNKAYINAILASGITTLESNDMKSLMSLFGSDQLDDANVATFISNNAPLAVTLSSILS